MNDVSKKVVVLLAHPNLKESQANKALADAVKDIDGVMVYDLYEYQDQSFDVNVWSTIISDASMVVFQFPFHWMSAPSLLKRWLDEVFTSLAKTPSRCRSSLQQVRSMPLTVAEAGIVSRWMNFCVLIRDVQYMPE